MRTRPLTYMERLQNKHRIDSQPLITYMDWVRMRQRSQILKQYKVERLRNRTKYWVFPGNWASTFVPQSLK